MVVHIILIFFNSINNAFDIIFSEWDYILMFVVGLELCTPIDVIESPTISPLVTVLESLSVLKFSLDEVR